MGYPRPRTMEGRIAAIKKTPTQQLAGILATELKVFKAIKPATAKAHERARGIFLEYVSDKGGVIHVNGKAVATFADLAAPGMSFPPVELIGDVVKFYADGAKGIKEAKVQASTVWSFYHHFSGAWTHSANRLPGLDKETRAEYERSITEVARRHPETHQISGIDQTSVFFLVNEIINPDFEAPNTERFSTVTAVAVASNVGFRPSSLGVPRGVAVEISGLRYSNFVFVVSAREGGGTAVLSAWVRPQWAKSDWSMKYYPIAEAPLMRSCSLIMVLGKAFFDGVLEERAMRTIFSSGHDKPKRFSIKASRYVSERRQRLILAVAAVDTCSRARRTGSPRSRTRPSTTSLGAPYCRLASSAVSGCTTFAILWLSK